MFISSIDKKKVSYNFQNKSIYLFTKPAKKLQITRKEKYPIGKDPIGFTFNNI